MNKFIKYYLFLIFIIFYLSVLTYAEEISEYHNYNDMTTLLKKISKNNSNIMQLNSVGTSLNNKEIWCVSISGKEQHKNNPAILIVGGVEGVDIVSSEMCLQFIHTIAANYSTDDNVKQLLQNTTFYIFPRVNPDATETYFSSLKYERHLNSNSIDLDKDGLIDEDGFDDLNGDGVITLIRITDPAGEYLCDKDIPELLKKHDYSKGEKGKYRLITEGIDNDGDGKFNEDEFGGVNFNNNFTYNYKFFKKGSGAFQLSEIESKAVIDFAFSHTNIAVVFTFSANENLINPWKKQQIKEKKSHQRRYRMKPLSSVLSEDAPYYNYISEKFKEITKLTDAPKNVNANGAFNEWAYYHFGRWSFSSAAWLPPVIEDTADTTVENKENKEKKETKTKKERKTSKQKDTIAKERRLWKWLKATGQDDAFVNWTAISHPDFPDQKVEVGGFKPYKGINPPADSLSNQAAKFNEFLLDLARKLPDISTDKFKIEKVHPNIYRVAFTIINNGYFPTNTKLGERLTWNPKVRINSELNNNQKIISGKKMTFVDTIPGNSCSKEFCWLIEGKKDSKINFYVGSPMTGIVQKEVILH